MAWSAHDGRVITAPRRAVVAPGRRGGRLFVRFVRAFPLGCRIVVSPARRRRVRAAGVRPVFRPGLKRNYLELRGLHRIFNAAEYRFYRSNVGPPAETATPFATNATLPHEPADTYADGTWWLAVSYFDGVLDSGFLPLGPHGERFVRLDIAAAAVAASPPRGPADWRLEVVAGGLIKLHALYFQTGSNRATEWALTYTTDSSDPGEPPAVAPTATVAMPSSGVAVLLYDLPVVGGGVEYRVRLQSRRPDGAGWQYSEDSVIRSAVADTAGGVAAPDDDPVKLERWPGRLPEDF